MKKYFVVSDIHSFWEEFKKALLDNGFDVNNPEHTLIVCGDLFDRGPDTLQVYQFIKSLPKERRILIRGNHEYLLKELVERKKVCYHDISNGTVRTLLALNGYNYSYEEIYYNLVYATYEQLFDEEEPFENKLKRCYTSKKTKEVLKWIFSDEWCNYYELDNYIFTHAFIPVNKPEKEDMYNPIYANLSYNPDWRNSSDKDFEDATWGCPYKLFDSKLFNEEANNNKILVVGHWHASDFHLHYETTEYYTKEYEKIENCTPYIGKNIIAIDACTAYSCFCNIIILEETEQNGLKLINNNYFNKENRIPLIIKEKK